MTITTIKTLIARQGIYNKEGMVWGYELLYRDRDDLSANVNNDNQEDGDAATSSVITQLFTNLDIDLVIGRKLALINFTYNHLVRQIPKLLPRNRIIIEVLENIFIDDLLITSLISLRKDGYKIALDDFIFSKEMTPLIEIADIIKIDVLNQNKQQIRDQLALLKGFKGKLLAEKIENEIQFNWCMELGFDYFQGFFLNRPVQIKGKILTENKLHLLRIFTELSDMNVSLQRIEEFILQIPKLSYRILRLANSVALYKGKKIESLMDAINKLGLLQIRNWLSLLLLSSMDEVVSDLLERTLIRAKMCEIIAEKTHYPNPHLAYTVGIFSTLDIFFNEPMPSLLAKIQLSDQLNEALLNRTGELGAILQFIMDYEVANFNQLESIPINIEEITQSYIDSIGYMNSIIKLIT